MDKYREEYFKNHKGNNGWHECKNCGKKIRKSQVDVDHIKPKNKGGTDAKSNLQALCVHCNRSKKNKIEKMKE